MNLMGIRIVTKFPKYINVYDLRVHDRIEKKLLSSDLNTETDSFWNPDNWSNPIYTQIPSGRFSVNKHLTIEEYLL